MSEGMVVAIRLAVAALVAASLVYGQGTALGTSPPAPVRAPSSLGFVRIGDVIEGDTLVYEQGPHQFRIRVTNALTPKGDTCGAAGARGVAKALLLGQWVRLTHMENKIGAQRAARVLVEGRDFGELLVTQGWAFARYDTRAAGKGHGARLLEERARTAARGMWGNCFRPGHLRIANVDAQHRRVSLKSTIEARDVDRWQLRRVANGWSKRLHLGVLPASGKADIDLPPGGGMMSRRYREPFILERLDGTWASVWVGGPPLRSGPAAPYGVYYANSEDFPELKSMGVNVVVLPYHPGIRAQLDDAYASGLRVLVIGGAWLSGEGASARARPVIVSRQLRLIRDHPALWGYNSVDEPAHRLVPLSVLQDLYAAAKEQDPHHPVMVVFDQVATFGTASNPFSKRVADIAAFDIYPVNYQGYNPWIPRFLPSAAETARRVAPDAEVWLVAQGFGEGALVQPTASQFVQQVREATELGGAEGVVSFVWDRHYQDRFPHFAGDLKSSPELCKALRQARRLLR